MHCKKKLDPPEQLINSTYHKIVSEANFYQYVVYVCGGHLHLMRLYKRGILEGKSCK